MKERGLCSCDVTGSQTLGGAPHQPRQGRPHGCTLLIAGERDRFYTPELRETAERIPNARLSLHRSKGHAGV
jgi:hypothetical protein